MPPTAIERRQQQRQSKQKKLLIALVPVLIAVLAFALPRTLKQLRGTETPPAETTAAATAEGVAPAQTDGSPADGTQTAPQATAEASGDPAVIAASAKRVLKDTDAPPAADEGQLISFNRFEARDPFVQIVDDQPVDTSTTDASGGTSAPVPPPATGVTTPPPTTPPPTTGGTTDGSTDTGGQVTDVKIAVNGRVSVVAVGDTFPESDPAFKVVSVSSDSIEIGLVSGSFSSGNATLTLKLGEPVTLISQPDGARFTIKFVGSA
jgi:hypothetical protein